MPSFIQYHNAARMGWVPLDAAPFLQTSLAISTARRSVSKAVGGTVYLVVGLGLPRRFYLWECFQIERVSAQGGRYFAEGRGWQLAPPQRLHGQAFNDFKRACASFVSFRSIDRSPYVAVLEGLALRYRRRVFDEEVVRFCDDLVATLPSSGDVRFARGFVHQSMGEEALARADLEEALRLGTEFQAEAGAALVRVTVPL